MKEEILAKKSKHKEKRQMLMIIEYLEHSYAHHQGFHICRFCITEDYELSKDISQEVFWHYLKVKETGLFQTRQIESTGDESNIQQMYGLL